MNPREGRPSVSCSTRARGRRVVLTGCCGYIGHVLSRRLRRRAMTLVGVDRASTYTADVDELIRGDLLDDGVLERALTGADCVYHLAAAKGDWGISEEEYFRDNLEATRRLLREGERRGIEEWVFFSTVAAMGPSAGRDDEVAALTPINPYGRSKASAERLFHEFARRNPGAKIVIVRPSVVFGPENPPTTNMYRLIDALYRRRFVMVGNGTTRKSTSYLDNLLAATEFVTEKMSRGVDTHIYIDEPVPTTGWLVDEICSLLGRRSPKIRVPLGVAKVLGRLADAAAVLTGTDLPITGARVEKFCRPTFFDGSAIREAGFRQPISMRYAIERTVEWYLDEETTE